jgi:methionyl-tRNA formyltransferase
MTPSPVKVAATELGLQVTDSLDAVLEAGAELGVVVAYGRIVPASVLERLPMVNLHFSLLPRWRGAAPVERAILEGDAETGVCLMAVEAGLDTGRIYAEAGTVIDDETAEELRARLVAMGCRLLEDHLGEGLEGLPIPRDQMGTPSYAEKILPSELELHWEQPALEIRRVIRIGRAWTTFRARRLGVLSATEVPEPPDPPDVQGDGGTVAPPGSLHGTDVTAGGRSRLRLVTVHPEGRRPMDAAQWIRGVRPGPDDVLGR